MKRVWDRLHHGDLWFAVALGAGACLAVYALPNVSAVRATFGLPFMLCGTGYVVMCALYGRDRPEGSLQLLLSLVLSIAATILIALALNLVALPIEARTVVTAELGVALAAVVVALIRRGSAPGRRLSGPASGILRSAWLWSALVAVSAAAGAIVFLSRPLPNNRVAGYTALWALRAGTSSIQVGVQSAETVRRTYRVDILTATGVRIAHSVLLSPGQQWSQTIQVGPPAKQTIVVRLYRSSTSGQIYRQITLRA